MHVTKQLATPTLPGRYFPPLLSLRPVGQCDTSVMNESVKGALQVCNGIIHKPLMTRSILGAWWVYPTLSLKQKPCMAVCECVSWGWSIGVVHKGGQSPTALWES
jgi:hypothetical protein